MQYDSKNDTWSTWLSKFKTEIPEITDEVKDLLDLFNDDTLNLKNLSKSELKSFFDDDTLKHLTETKDGFMNFIDEVDLSGDIFAQYQLHLKNSANSMNLFQIATKKAGAALKSLGGTLENLCDSLGITGEMYQTVISLKNSLAAVESGAPIEAFQSSIEYARKHIAELAKGDYEFGFKFKADPKSTSGSAKDIAEEFKNLLDAELKVLDTKMDAGLINFNDYIAQRLALIQKYYDEGKIKASDYYDYLSKHYETQLSYMDKVTSYVTTRIDKEIESYNKQINQIKEKYQTEIDYLDTVIDYYEKQKEALQDANTQRELQLALDKALYEFEKAQQMLKLVILVLSSLFRV